MHKCSLKSSNFETKTTLHVETGFIKFNPDTQEVALCLIAHNLGLSSNITHFVQLHVDPYIDYKFKTFSLKKEIDVGIV